MILKRPKANVRVMKVRKLGKSGIKVSALGMGCAAIGGSYVQPSGRIIGYGHVKDEDSIQAVQKGLDLGVTLFDTSNVYGCGRSERVLGKSLKERRDEVVIATKFGMFWNFRSSNSEHPCQVTGDEVKPGFIRKSCEESLERLKTDYIDLYQLHVNRMNPEKAPRVIKTLEDLVEEGKIRYYGWSTDDPDRAKVFSKQKHCTIVQFKHNLTFHNERMIEEVINRFNVAGLIKGPLGSGILTGKYRDDSRLPKNHMLKDIKFDKGRIAEVRAILEEMREILTEDGRTLAQAALGWIWAKNDQLVPIPGFKNVKQVEENAGAMEYGSLSNNQVSQVKKILVRIETELKTGYFT